MRLPKSPVPTAACRILLALVMAAGAPPAALALEADSADDVCAPDADPCVVSDPVRIVDGSILDFGTRDIQVTGGGYFDVGGGVGRVLCGDFEATSPTVVDVSAFEESTSEGGEVDGGSFLLHARRECSASAEPYPCLSDTNCDLGTCSVRRCSDSPTTLCSSDTNCQLGSCQLNRRCAGNFTVRCLTNADCDLGTCPAQLSCSVRPYDTVECASNTDCELGTCSVGEGSISMGGTIRGGAAIPGVVELRAAGSVSLSGPVNLSSSSADGNGGDLRIVAYQGRIDITGRIHARGGHYGTGGDVELDAGEDLTIAAKMNLNGGDYDGGQLYAFAVRDVWLDASVLASSRRGAGYGGIIELNAVRDVWVGAAGGRVDLVARGHRNRFNEGGDGGGVTLEAERNVSVSEGTRIRIDAGSGGYAGDVDVEAEGSIEFDGDVFGEGRGDLGGAGYVYFDAIGPLTVGPTAEFRLAGEEDGGALEISSSSDLQFSGRARLRSGADPFFGTGGAVQLISGDRLTLSGELSLDGGRSDVEIEACRLTLTSDARIRSKKAGRTDLIARESMSLLAGSEVETVDGVNYLQYRTADKPPLVAGSVSPAPVLHVTEGPGCPVCGNSEIDYLETCDDGNVTDGDGCSSLCQTE